MPKTHLDNNTKVNYKNVIRHLHFRNILQKTKSGLQGLPSFLDVLFDLYIRNVIDYKILTPSALHYLEAGRIGSVFSSFYFRASIMNPYLVFSLNQRVLKGTRIFTPTLGWSSYAYGFAECPQVEEYVGVDVITDVAYLLTNDFYAVYLYPPLFPLLCGLSRKSIINKVINTTANEALNGTTVLNTIALLNGAHILRVHDVLEAQQAIELVHYYSTINSQ
jgi:hypothetical protein